MKIWVDDIRPAPVGYIHKTSVNKTKTFIEYCEYMSSIISENDYNIEIIDIDHDAGNYVSDGGDYIKLLDWLEETDRNYPIRIHSMNPVGVRNMRAVIKRNGWKEIY